MIVSNLSSTHEIHSCMVLSVHYFSLCFLLLFCSFWLIYLFIFKIYFLSFVNISTSFYISRNRQTIFSVNVSWIGEDLSPMFTLVLAIQVLHQVPSHTSWDPQSRCYWSLGVVLRLGLHFCCSLSCMAPWALFPAGCFAAFHLLPHSFRILFLHRAIVGWRDDEHCRFLNFGIPCSSSGAHGLQRHCSLPLVSGRLESASA